MKRALVVGSSGGIGSAIAKGLTESGVQVSALSRSQTGMDLTDPEALRASFRNLEGPFDLVLAAAGILAPAGASPEKTLDSIELDRMVEVLTVNAVGPALILQQVQRLLPRRGRSVTAVLTARVGSIGDNQMGGWYSYRASKAAANQIVRTAALEIGRRRKEAIVVALHPGTVATPFTANYPVRDKFSPEESAAKLLSVIDGLSVEQTGRFFDYAGREVPW